MRNARRPHERALWGLVVGCALVLVAPSARAQDAATTGTATVLFDEAVALMGRGQYAEACPKLARSNELSPNGGTLFALAECYERSGKIASAWITYKEAAIRASAAKRVDAETKANDSAERLAPSLSRLSLQVPAVADVAGLAIELDGRAVARAEWGIATPIDPGPHKIRMSAPGRVPATRDVVFDRVAAQKIVSIPALEPASEPAAPAEGAPRGRAQRILGLIVGGVGLGGVAVGTVFGLQASSKNDQAAGHCHDSTLCDAQGIRLDKQAHDAATISTVAFIAGGALAASGLVLILTAPRGREKSSALVQSAVLGVRGSPGGGGTWRGGGGGGGAAGAVTLDARF